MELAAEKRSTRQNSNRGNHGGGVERSEEGGRSTRERVDAAFDVGRKSSSLFLIDTRLIITQHGSDF